MSRRHIEASEVFAPLGTTRYVRSLRNPDDPEHHRLTTQIIAARELGKPVVLLVDEDMDAADKQYLRDYFMDFDVLGEIPFNRGDAGGLSERLAKLLKERGD